jgi:hypothetical protein
MRIKNTLVVMECQEENCLCSVIRPLLSLKRERGQGGLSKNLLDSPLGGPGRGNNSPRKRSRPGPSCGGECIHPSWILPPRKLSVVCRPAHRCTSFSPGTPRTSHRGTRRIDRSEEIWRTATGGREKPSRRGCNPRTAGSGRRKT